MHFVVLMSTYNGERYIAEQLRSILGQLPKEGSVVVRDDGSTDATVHTIEGFNDERIKLHRGLNIGFARSFFELMRLAPPGADMYMLSDQDDVWLPQKVERAWRQVSQAGSEPFLYCTDTQLVDADLRPIGVGRKRMANGCLTEALAENQVTGCTVAMNSALMRLALPEGASLRDVHFHDWWLYVVATALGRVFCDPVPTTLYRQHGQNYIGAGLGVGRYLKMLAYLRRKNWLSSMVGQIRALKACHGSRLSAAQHGELDALYANDRGLRRWAMVCRWRKHRASLSGEILLRLLLIFEWRRLE